MTLGAETPNPGSLDPRKIAGALAWWREAGVDLDFADDPSDWLDKPAPETSATPPESRAAPPPPPVRAAPPPLPRFGGDPALWPQALEDFAPWWLTEPTLDGGATERRVPPRGPAGAALMVIVPQPEAGDSDNLLSGSEGKLLAAMLAAMGLAADAVYLAAALPRHTPMADWDALGSAGLGDLLSHHIKLVAPKRVLACLGNASSLLGHGPANNAHSLRVFHHEGANVTVLAAPTLAALAARPRGKARLWQDWLDWTVSD